MRVLLCVYIFFKDDRAKHVYSSLIYWAVSYPYRSLRKDLSDKRTAVPIPQCTNSVHRVESRRERRRCAAKIRCICPLAPAKPLKDMLMRSGVMINMHIRSMVRDQSHTSPTRSARASVEPSLQSDFIRPDHTCPVDEKIQKLATIGVLSCTVRCRACASDSASAIDTDARVAPRIYLQIVFVQVDQA